MIDEAIKPDQTVALARLLREGRKRKGWTLRQAAAETGISNGYLSLMEQGDVKAPSPRYLLLLAERYELPYDQLMGLAGHPSGQVPTTTGATPGNAQTPTAVSGRAATDDASREEEPVRRAWAPAFAGTFGVRQQDVEVADRAGPAGSPASTAKGAGDAEITGRSGAVAESSRTGPYATTGVSPEELSDAERCHLSELVLNDLAGLSGADIAQARAFIAGLRAARRT